jgi:hypothetical protein
MKLSGIRSAIAAVGGLALVSAPIMRRPLVVGKNEGRAEGSSGRRFPSTLERRVNHSRLKARAL